MSERFLSLKNIQAYDSKTNRQKQNKTIFIPRGIMLALCLNTFAILILFNPIFRSDDATAPLSPKKEWERLEYAVCNNSNSSHDPAYVELARFYNQKLKQYDQAKNMY